MSETMVAAKKFCIQSAMPVAEACRACLGKAFNDTVEIMHNDEEAMKRIVDYQFDAAADVGAALTRLGELPEMKVMH